MDRTRTSVSRIRRSLMCDDVRNLPSLPAIGESFTPNVMEIVGGSSVGDGIGSVTAESQIVSDTNAFTPAIVTMSPAVADVTSDLTMPRVTYILVTLPVSSCLLSRFSTWIGSPTLIVPAWMRPVARRPTYESWLLSK